MTTTNYKSIDDYIKSSRRDVWPILQKVRKTIKKTSPNLVETISYQMPTFKLNGKNIVHFAIFKNHLGFYPTPSAINKFKDILGKYKNSKGSVQFLLNKPIPYALISKIVKFRIREELKKVNKV